MQQSEALDILKLGHNVYLTGAAGSGKTYVLNQFIKYLRDNKISVGVTASTGIAATHMNGMTIHSWAGIGILDELQSHDIDRLLAKSALIKRFAETKVLIIDEISMLHGKRLDMLDKLSRAFRDPKKPFGGIQVVLSGDLFQLPPVTKSGPSDFVFESDAWNSMNLKICYLEEQHRQEDATLLDILGAIRGDSIDDSHFEHLNERFKPPPKSRTVTRLYTHNSAVDVLNDEELAQIDSEQHSYFMSSRGNKKLVAGLIYSCLAPEELRLKEGAEVMFVANSPGGQYVNGTLGKVIGFGEDNTPIVKTDKRTVSVTAHSWKVMDGEKTRAEITQLPLRLAWAITVHKSQGMSLDAAEVDLAKSFEPGMGYVALSRVRDLEGLFIKGINNTALLVSPKITKLDKKLRISSNSARKSLSGIKKDKIEEHHKVVRGALQSDEEKLLENYDESLFEKLRTWRLKQAKAQDAPAYVVLPDKTLKLIASIKPRTNKDLAKIKGIGPQKLEKYSKDLLTLTK